MKGKLINTKPKRNGTRKIQYDGDYKLASLVIGNQDHVEFTAQGNFELSGMIYSRKTVTFNVGGNGTLRFHGFCHNLIVNLAKGQCLLDFSELVCNAVQCTSLRDFSTTIIGRTEVISLANLQDEAILRYMIKSRLQSYSLSGKASIEVY